MNRVQALIGVLACATGTAVLGACGDVYADPDSLPAVTDAGLVTDTPAVFPNDKAVECPKSRPRESSRCSSTGSACEFGSSADRECNEVLACSGLEPRGAWSARPSDACFKNVCPELEDVATLDGKPCSLEVEVDAGTDAEALTVTDNDEAVCNMTDGVCACTTGRDGASRHERKWVCVRPISVCPPNRPLLGTPCSGSLWCDYGSCAFKRGLLMECTENVWLTGGAPCQ